MLTSCSATPLAIFTAAHASVRDTCYARDPTILGMPAGAHPQFRLGDFRQENWLASLRKQPCRPPLCYTALGISAESCWEGGRTSPQTTPCLPSQPNPLTMSPERATKSGSSYASRLVQ